MGTLLFNDNLIHMRITKLGKVMTQRKRLPDNATPETKTLQTKLFYESGQALPVIVWLRRIYGWSLTEAVNYFKQQTGVIHLTQRHTWIR